MTREQARALVAGLQALREQASDKTASEAVGCFPTLKQDGALVEAGTRINWNGELLRAAVDLWDTAENAPDSAPTLWERVEYHNGYRIIPETITATQAFALGEVGWWPEDGKLYKSGRDGNVYPPSVTPEWWERMEDGA